MVRNDQRDESEQTDILRSVDQYILSDTIIVTDVRVMIRQNKIRYVFFLPTRIYNKEKKHPHVCVFCGAGKISKMIPITC